MWQAWMKVDLDCPTSKPSDDPWPRIPTPDQIRETLAHVATKPE